MGKLREGLCRGGLDGTWGGSEPSPHPSPPGSAGMMRKEEAAAQCLGCSILTSPHSVGGREPFPDISSHLLQPSPPC